jgi:hypothetical protein
MSSQMTTINNNLEDRIKSPIIFNDGDLSNNIITTIIKDEDKNDTSVAHLNKNVEKKPKYLQINSKSKKNVLQGIQNIQGSPKVTESPDKNKKKKVKFKQDFINEVWIESYKEYNLKMCFMEMDLEQNDNFENNSESACKKCVEKMCLIF